MRELDEVFEALRHSEFRQRFHLRRREREYLRQKGMKTVMKHAREFINKRLVPAYPKNDGKQTPMKNHPVFIAQHATGTCCRNCLRKWHKIPKGRRLSKEEKQHVLEAIRRWLEAERKKM